MAQCLNPGDRKKGPLGAGWLLQSRGHGLQAPAARGHRRIDAAHGKITLKHGPIDNLGMPGMTMVFRADPAVLGSVKVGDQVKFKADKVDGSIKVTELSKAP